MASIEQLPPNKPNFLLVVILSAVAMVAIFLFCFFVLHWDGRQLMPGKDRSANHSALTLPGSSTYST